jgi:outer membrane protein assembly factor BamB
MCLVGGPGSTIVAFDTGTGQEIWRALTAKEPGYAPPVIVEAGGKRQLIVWHPEAVNSLDPVTGSVYWSEPWAIQNGLSVCLAAAWKFALSHELLQWLRCSGWIRKKPGAAVLWKSKKSSEMDTTELHSIMPTPAFDSSHIYGVCSYGQLRGLKAQTGERLWETLAATTKDGKPVRWGNAFLVKNGDRFFLFNELGDLIIARLTPQGYDEISRAHLLEPTNHAAGRPVVWSHPAFANRTLYARNDHEIIAVNLAR